MSIDTYPLLSVDKYGDKVVDKKRYNISEEYVSPYLRRPLRSLADALAERKSPKTVASRGSEAKIGATKRPALSVADENHP